MDISQFAEERGISPRPEAVLTPHLPEILDAHARGYRVPDIQAFLKAKYDITVKEVSLKAFIRRHAQRQADPLLRINQSSIDGSMHILDEGRGRLAPDPKAIAVELTHDEIVAKYGWK